MKEHLNELLEKAQKASENDYEAVTCYERDALRAFANYVHLSIMSPDRVQEVKECAAIVDQFRLIDCPRW